MTTEELYEELMPIGLTFAEEADQSSDSYIHATNTVLCFFMNALQELNDKNPNSMMNMSLVINLNRDRLRKQ
jgi:hypothetical protein